MKKITRLFVNPVDDKAAMRHSDMIRELMSQMLPVLRGADRALYGIEAKIRLYEPVGPSRIAAFERKHGIQFPPSYRLFLQLHNGWEGYADGYALIGVTGHHTSRALADIDLTVESFLDSWSLAYGEPDEEKIRQYELSGNLVNLLEESCQPFIPNKIHFATNFNGGLRFFDPTRPSLRGEMEVICWSTTGGTVARYPNFVAMLRGDLRRLKAAVQRVSDRRPPRG